MSNHWTQRHEGGGRFALWLIRGIGLYLGRRAARILLCPITLYFFVRRGPERRASRAFLARASGRPATSWSVLRHFHCYAATILDRIFLLARSTRGFDVHVEGLQDLHAQIDAGRGVLLLGAHIGSFEVLRALADLRPEIVVRTVMDRQQTPAMTRLLHALNPQAAASVIDAGNDGTSCVLAMAEAAREGALIGFLGDRARLREATSNVVFFGAEAAFPVAPYLIASALGLPIMLCFGLYRGGNRYDLYFENFAERIELARETRTRQLADWARRYANRLEHYTRQAPCNWFNFYDFWDSAADGNRVASCVDGQPVA